jgi:dTDP-4-amino-4,6-dideoxygalactose transaminase
MSDGHFPTWPFFDEEERSAVDRVLASGRVNQWTGEEVEAFEREFAAYHEVPYAVALANGTVALELALEALGVGPGDDVVVTPRTFLASAPSIVLRGAQPVFADVDTESGNITPETVRAALTPNTRAVMAVHLAGWPCDMAGLRLLADQHDLFLIEDCAQAHGATWRGRLVGGFGDAAAFSFCTDKIMSTGGEGGMVLFHDEAAWRRAWSYKDHGKDWDAVYSTEHPPGFRWLHESFGTNWRLTEMQAAIGRVQLRKLPDWLARRRRNAAILTERLSTLPALRVPVHGNDIGHAYYKFYAYVRPEQLRKGWGRDRIMEVIQARGVPCGQGSCPEVYLEKAFRKQEPTARGPDGASIGPDNRLPVARELGEMSLMSKVHPTSGDDDIARMAEVVEEVVEEAQG